MYILQLCDVCWISCDVCSISCGVYFIYCDVCSISCDVYFIYCVCSIILLCTMYILYLYRAQVYRTLIPGQFLSPKGGSNAGIYLSEKSFEISKTSLLQELEWSIIFVKILYCSSITFLFIKYLNIIWALVYLTILRLIFVEIHIFWQ